MNKIDQSIIAMVKSDLTYLVDFLYTIQGEEEVIEMMEYRDEVLLRHLIPLVQTMIESERQHTQGLIETGMRKRAEKGAGEENDENDRTD